MTPIPGYTPTHVFTRRELTEAYYDGYIDTNPLDDGLTIPRRPTGPVSQMFPGFEVSSDPAEAARDDVRIARIAVKGIGGQLADAVALMFAETGKYRALSRVAIRRDVLRLKVANGRYRAALRALAAVRDGGQREAA